mmetsp:Transcript_7923/g.23585  ORF Transcript_7923/g.23585 Transcript_7923/m.23585 type:complete len:446 (+) Transcript_7923:1265-2602(+)
MGTRPRQAPRPQIHLRARRRRRAGRRRRRWCLMYLSGRRHPRAGLGARRLAPAAYGHRPGAHERAPDCRDLAVGRHGRGQRHEPRRVLVGGPGLQKPGHAPLRPRGPQDRGAARHHEPGQAHAHGPLRHLRRLQAQRLVPGRALIIRHRLLCGQGRGQQNGGLVGVQRRALRQVLLPGDLGRPGQGAPRGGPPTRGRLRALPGHALRALLGGLAQPRDGRKALGGHQLARRDHGHRPALRILREGDISGGLRAHQSLARADPPDLRAGKATGRSRGAPWPILLCGGRALQRGLRAPELRAFGAAAQQQPRRRPLEAGHQGLGRDARGDQVQVRQHARGAVQQPHQRRGESPRSVCAPLHHGLGDGRPRASAQAAGQADQGQVRRLARGVAVRPPGGHPELARPPPGPARVRGGAALRSAGAARGCAGRRRRGASGSSRASCGLRG